MEIEEIIMPGGHASHKSTSAKPNTNANGVINTEDDAPVDAPDITTQSSTSTRPDEAPKMQWLLNALQKTNSKINGVGNRS